MSDLVGRVIAHYRLDGLVGDGGMGTVYRAYDLNLDRTVAIKLMHAHFARQPEFRARLTQEAKTAAQLDHPSIVRIIDFGESEEGLYIAMEHIGGGNLRAHLYRLQSQQRYLPLNQALQIGVQMADALDYAHRRGVIHRDVKPSNIILKRLSNSDEPGEQPFRAVLTDFGLVRLLNGNHITQSGTTLGTPTYMSPEQVQGQELDGRSDLYSLGVVLYELITNRLPFDFESLSEALMVHVQRIMPKPASELRPGIPPMIDAILAKTLAKAREGRYADGADMATTLRSAMFALEDAPTRVLTQALTDDVLTPSANQPPQGYQLHITAPGYTPSQVALTRMVISLGRGADNDVVLPADGVSRRHARLMAADVGWTIMDLGGINGTFLNDQRLPANKAVPWPMGAPLKIGPFTLTLVAPSAVISTPHPAGWHTSAAVPVAEQPTAAVPERRPGPAAVAPVQREAFEVELEPKELKLPGVVRVTIRNSGNTRLEMSLIGREPREEIRFQGERGRIGLEPRQLATVDLQLEARGRNWIGGLKNIPYQVEVTSRAGTQQVLVGEAQIESWLPPMGVYALVFLLTFGCILGIIFFLFGRDRLLPSDGTPIAAATATSLAATQMSGDATGLAMTATMAASTLAAETAAALGDTDEDGLSDAQEAIALTDPNNPDTDNDGLLDGEEVLTHGTDPRKRDTDNDLLSDGDEVNVYETNPLNPDSDGDGVPDGAEVALGTDPLAPPSPTATPQASATATAAVAPSGTPSPSPTGTAAPSTTPSVTPSATFSPTPTSEPTNTPTAAPSSTSIPTITSTPTNTPEPNPALVCVDENPTIDGTFDEDVWGDEPLITFTVEDEPELLVETYFVRSDSRLYLAFLIHDDTADDADSLRVYLDTTNNEGDPDTADRFFQIGRNGTLTIQAGIGSNSDGLEWDADYTSSNWTAAVGEQNDDVWVVEMEINAISEVGALANPFGLMLQVLFTNEALATWPEEADSADAGTWQDVDNVFCP